MVVPGEIVQLRGRQEVVGQDRAWEGWVRAARGDGDEGAEGAGEVVQCWEEVGVWRFFLVGKDFVGWILLLLFEVEVEVEVECWSRWRCRTASLILLFLLLLFLLRELPAHVVA